MSAVIRPAVDFESLSRVMIVTSVDIEIMEKMAEEAYETESETSEEEE